MSVTPSRPLAKNTSGGRNPAARSSVSSPRVTGAITAPSLARLSVLMLGRSTRDHVSTYDAMSGDKTDVVIGLGGRERDQVPAVEVDPVGVAEIRVFAGCHPARDEPDLALCIIDLEHVAHHPCAAGDAVWTRPVRPSIRYRWFQAVALGRPDDLVALAADVIREPAIGIDKGPGVLGDGGMRRTSGGIDRDDPRLPEATPDVVERDALAVARPARRGELIGIGEQRGVDHGLLAGPLRRTARLFLVDRVAGAWGRAGCAALVGSARGERLRRGARGVGSRADTVDHQVAAVGGPAQGFRVVEVAGGAVGAEGSVFYSPSLSCCRFRGHRDKVF